MSKTQKFNVPNQSVRIPKKDLELLIELAESNQYRLDLELASTLVKLKSNQCNCK